MNWGYVNIGLYKVHSVHETSCMDTVKLTTPHSGVAIGHNVHIVAWAQSTVSCILGATYTCMLPVASVLREVWGYASQEKKEDAQICLLEPF